MLKKTLFQHCIDHLNKSLGLFEQRKSDLLVALESESKSSAGDKHETGRAMLQLEREKLGEQIKETERNLKLLLPLENHVSSKTITIGSVVKTDQLSYYIAVSTTELKVDMATYYCISAQSPIGKLLLGKKVGETISFNHKTSSIIEIL